MTDDDQNTATTSDASEDLAPRFELGRDAAAFAAPAREEEDAPRANGLDHERGETGSEATVAGADEARTNATSADGPGPDASTSTGRMEPSRPVDRPVDARLTAALNTLTARVARHGETIRSEEAIKATLVGPLLTAMGHDVADPDLVEVAPRAEEARADFATLDGDGARLMLVAVASNPDDVESKRAQAMAPLIDDRTVAALLTDGRRFRFHGVEEGRIEPHAFLSFEIGTHDVEADDLTPLTRDRFDMAAARESGRRARIVDRAWDEMLAQTTDFGAVSHALARVLGGENPTRRIVAGVEAMLEHVGEAMRLYTTGDLENIGYIGANGEPRIVGEGTASELAVVARRRASWNRADNETDRVEGRRPLNGDEQAGFEMVRRIATQHGVDPEQIFARPAQSYLAILHTDNNRRPICRLYFQAQSTRHIGTFVGAEEEKKRMAGYADIAEHEPAIVARLRELEPGGVRAG